MPEPSPKPRKPAAVKLGWWLLGFLALAVLGLWLAHERAKARLNAHHQLLVAKGERVTLAGHVPPPPLAASNGVIEFCKVIELLPKADNSDAGLHRPWPMMGIAPGKAMVSWKQVELPRERSWLSRGSSNRFTAVLWPEYSAYLNANRERLAELVTTLDRPAFSFPFDAGKFLTDSGTEWFMAPRKGLEWLVSATLHDLRFGSADEAWRWWRAGSRLALRAENPRAVAGLMIQSGSVARCVNATWEALQYPGWNDAQLAEIQQLWLNLDALQHVVDGFSMERAYAIEAYALNRTNWPKLWTSAQLHRGGFAALMAGPPDAWKTALRNEPLETLKATIPLIPWPFWTSYSEELAALQLQTGMVEAWQAAQATGSFQRGLTAANALGPLRPAASYWRLFSDDGFEVWSATGMARYATFVVQSRIALAAVALHRHKLKHGGFPSDLNALVPAWLPAVPRDFMDGNPLRYRLEPDGQFRLWSVGEDFKDDGGDATPATPPEADDSFFWLKGRDWVWPQPATEADVAAFHADLAARRTSPAP